MSRVSPPLAEPITYLDNVATSWPKPEGFEERLVELVRTVGSNPGRSGHRLSIAASRSVEKARNGLAELFHVEHSSRIAFTKNATEGLNLALYGFLAAGDRAVISGMEHNSVARPTRDLEAKGLEAEVCLCDTEGYQVLASLEEMLQKKTKPVAICHVSNVTGTVQDVKRVADTCHRHDAKLLQDASQRRVTPSRHRRAGTWHRCTGLHSAQGAAEPARSGWLIMEERIELELLMRSDTGSRSDSEFQPDFMPDKYESGTLNTIGIHALSSSLDFIRLHRREIEQKEKELTQTFIEGAREIDCLLIPGPKELSPNCGVALQFPLRERPRAEQQLAVKKVRFENIFEYVARTSW